MGDFSMWHWVIVLFVVGVPALLLGLVVFLAVKLATRKSARIAVSSDISNRD